MTDASAGQSVSTFRRKEDNSRLHVSPGTCFLLIISLNIIGLHNLDRQMEIDKQMVRLRYRRTNKRTTDARID